MDKDAIGLSRVQQCSHLCVARPYQIYVNSSFGPGCIFVRLTPIDVSWPWLYLGASDTCSHQLVRVYLGTSDTKCNICQLVLVVSWYV